MANSEPLLSWSDEELLAGFRQGQREAFGLLVRRYERELYGYLRRYLGDDSLADDVFQNTFLQVFVKIEQYEAGRPVRPWLYTIATNQAVDALRRNGRRPAASLDQMVRETGEGEVRSLLDLLEADSPDPLVMLQDEERRLKVRASVDQLPDFLRQVVILAYYQGLKYRDVAEILDIPVGTVKSRLHAALGKLHEIWTAGVARSEPRKLKPARK
ncbi:MAG TPA: sigma-70 family RNA polymerase sigma factor [Gemmataceae bacterium]|nr:sigma-70 family RNA polymerase sigma factor [Gemmataceae bacterium]